jgi:uncharacterized protein YggE
MYAPSLMLTVVIASALLAAPVAAAESDNPPALTINGRAEVQVAPDIAFVTVGVTSEAETAAAALAANNVALSKALEVIRAAGVEARDLQTSGLSLQARYHYPRDPSDKDRQRIIGYVANNNVTVRVRDLTKLGSLLDKVVTAGANQILGIAFDVSERDRLLDDARRKAVADARRKAELYAAAAGIKLGKLRSLSESTVSPRPRTVRMAAPAAAAAPPVPIEAGELTLSANVQMTWGISE